MSEPPHTHTALTVFHNICQAWGLSDKEEAELVGTPGSAESMQRISQVMGIYKDLRILFPSDQQVHAWIRKPNRDFGGQPALQIILEDPAPVRRYRDAQIG